MLDIKQILLNKDEIEANLRKRDSSISLDALVALEQERKKQQTLFDTSRGKINSGQVTLRSLPEGSEQYNVQRDMLRDEKESSGDLTKTLKTLESQIHSMLLQLPNVVNIGVPVSDRKEDKKIMHVFDTPPTFGFKPLDHVTLGKRLGILDFERAAKMSESGFPLYIGKGALLEWALINYMIQHAVAKNYQFMLFPLLNNTASLTGSGNLPKFAEEIYSCARDELHLIPTAEVPLTNFYRGETLPEGGLPLRFASYSPCFRREAGSYGKMSRGLMRMHQFNKVETYSFCTPAQAEEEHKALIRNGEEILEELGLHYRLANLPSCDLAAQSAQTFDIEIWLPHLGDYSEVSSASNCRDFQSRRAEIRYKGPVKKGFVYTLNCSALATSRVMIALLETGQTIDGKIRIPDALQKYTGFCIIE